MKRPSWARLGWADPSPERGGTPGGAREQGGWRGPDTEEATWQEPASEPASTGRSRDIPGVPSVHPCNMPSVSLESTSDRLALIPMIGFIGLGMGSATLYLLRLAVRSPDVCWDRKNNPEPWNRLSPNDQYKFLAVSTDYKKLKKDRPDF
ncbi:NADH dehydrogenase [ubiquinone] 1 alpha subcomplex subunit 4-like 2 isoform X2 [Monodon monoceros]|nr:NADH dehydrogenase [ubiquinone] 1 alpha subcomplex subunit 4-like 2 isoform X2 [Monodon monoceros]